MSSWSWNCPTLYASEEERLWFANWLRVGASAGRRHTR